MREEGCNDNQITKVCKLFKPVSNAVPFNKVLPLTLETLGLKRAEDVDISWDPPRKEFVPSERFSGIVKDLLHAWGMTTEMARRTLIDAYLLEVLSNKKDEHGNTLYPYKIWCEVKMETDEVQGILDYAGTIQSVAPTRPYLLVLEAKVEWPMNAYCQLLAEMYAILKNNENSLPIYGVLSNGSDWQFFKLDTDLKWHESIKYMQGEKTKEILGVLAAMFDSK